MVQKTRFHFSFGKQLPFEDKTIANPLMKIYEKITSGKMNDSNSVPMNHIAPPLPRTADI